MKFRRGLYEDLKWVINEAHAMMGAYDPGSFDENRTKIRKLGREVAGLLKDHLVALELLEEFMWSDDMECRVCGYTHYHTSDCRLDKLLNKYKMYTKHGIKP